MEPRGRAKFPIMYYLSGDVGQPGVYEIDDPFSSSLTMYPNIKPLFFFNIKPKKFRSYFRIFKIDTIFADFL